jgi:hypothetical protein
VITADCDSSSVYAGDENCIESVPGDADGDGVGVGATDALGLGVAV